MKNILLILSLFISLGILAQESGANKITENQKILKQIPGKIQKAVNNENYQIAANLKDELSIRKKIEVANNQGNFDRVVELENQLSSTSCKPKPNKDCVREKQRDIERKEEPEDYGPDPFSLYLEFMPAAYVNTQDNSPPPNNEVYPGQNNVNPSQDLFGGGFRIGSSIYFGDMDKDLKVGLDILYASGTVAKNSFGLLDGMTMTYASLSQPGVVVTKYFNNKSGIDFKANTGVMFDGRFGIGMSGTAKVKYWIKKFAVGVEYQYGSPFESDFNINQVGLNLGLRF